MDKRDKQLVELICSSDSEHINEQLQNDPDMINAEDSAGLLPLHHCIMSGHNEIAELFISRGATTDIFSAAGLGFVDDVERKLKEMPDLHASRDPLGLTPLHWAALGGQVKVSEILLASGADVNARDKAGVTPLHCAAINGQKAVAKLLLYQGADAEAVDNNGVWPALRAVKEGQSELAEMLQCRLDEKMSARFCLGISAVLCAIEAVVAAVFLMRLHSRGLLFGTPYMFALALTLFAVSWIGFSGVLYGRLAGRQGHGDDPMQSQGLSLVVVVGGLIGAGALLGGVVSLVLAVRTVI